MAFINRQNKQEGYPAIAMKANGIKVKKDVVFLLNTNKIIPLKCFLYAFLSRRNLMKQKSPMERNSKICSL